MINAFCFYFGDDSWSRHARNLFEAWRRQEAVAISSWNGPVSGDLAVSSAALSRPSPLAPGIGLGPIEYMPTVVGSKRIAYIVWETTIMPPDKVSILHSMDEVWTPSTWGARMLVDNGIAPASVAAIPEGVDVDRFRPLHDEAVRASRPFRFLFVGKWEERKGVDLLIDAYCEEFRAEEPVELIVHGWNPYLPGFDLESWIGRAVGGRLSPPIIASRPVSEEAMIRLYNCCDAFVLPTRAEGWGLPIMEAMACGLPVIVTDYSAPCDYLDRDIGYLVPVEKLVPAYDPYFFPSDQCFGNWAQPDSASLRALMRHVYEHPEEAREKGRRARAEVVARWTWDHAATAARERLARAERKQESNAPR